MIINAQYLQQKTKISQIESKIRLLRSCTLVLIIQITN